MFSTNVVNTPVPTTAPFAAAASVVRAGSWLIVVVLPSVNEPQTAAAAHAALVSRVIAPPAGAALPAYWLAEACVPDVSPGAT